MTLFYAYLTSGQDDLYYRYLLTFANREVADEWWRTISTPPSPYAGNIQRISPQFYIQIQSNDIVDNFFSGPGAKKFLNNMFFTLLNVRDGRVLSIAPPIKITDHISDEWYFIRSQADTQRHWYFRINDDACLVRGGEDCDTIHVSAHHRTRFCIRVRNLPNQGVHAPKEFVMIGSDKISIAASNDYTLRINDANQLMVTKNQYEASDLLFDDLKNRFVTRSKKQEKSGEIWEYVVPVERSLGELWELVG